MCIGSVLSRYTVARGVRDGEEKNYDLLGPLLDITTTLDPEFNAAYRFGAIFLTEAYPNGPGRTDLAVALLKKGIERKPERWEYYMDIGFIYYWWVQDYEQAAEWFDRAAGCPRRFLVAAFVGRQHARGGRQS